MGVRCCRSSQVRGVLRGVLRGHRAGLRAALDVLRGVLRDVPSPEFAPRPVKRRRSWLAAPRLEAKTLFDAKLVPIGFAQSCQSPLELPPIEVPLPRSSGGMLHYALYILGLQLSQRATTCQRPCPSRGGGRRRPAASIV